MLTTQNNCSYRCLFCKLISYKKIKTDKSKKFPTPKELWKMVSTFVLVSLTFIVFRSNNIEQAVSFLSKIFSIELFKIPSLPNKVNIFNFALILFFTVFFVFFEWFQRKYDFGLQKKSKKIYINWFFYTMIISIIFLFGGSKQDFIYFQF